MTTHRRQVRPRYGRLVAALSSLGVTSVALLGGFGRLPLVQESAPRGAITPAAADLRPPSGEVQVDQRAATISTPGERRRITAADLLPADSGSGRRVVFSEGRQRVWLIGATVVVTP